MAAAFIRVTQQECTPGSAGSWQEEDMDDYSIGANAVGVWLWAKTSSSYNFGARKNGSTDDRHPDIFSNFACQASCGVDANGIAEIYVENTTIVDVYCMGYMDDPVTMNTNAVDISEGTTGSYQETDVTAYAPGASLIICERVTSGTYKNYLRKNGSTDDRYDNADSRFHDTFLALVGLDANDVYESKIENTAADTYLTGYYDGSNVTINTNLTDRSLSTTGSWTDLTALPSGAKVGFYHIHTTSITVASNGLRKNGDSNEPYGDMNRYNWGSWIEECDGSQLVEGKIENAATDFWELGYAEDEAGTVAGECAISSASSLSIAAIRKRPGAVTTTSVSSMTAGGNLVASAIAIINAVASVSAGGNKVTSAVAPISSVSSLSIDGDLIASAIATINSVSSLTVKTGSIIAAAVAIQSVASVIANGNFTASGELDIASVSSVASIASKIAAAAAVINSAPSLSLNGDLVAAAVVAINSVASLIADGDVVRGAIVAIEAASDLSANGVATMSGVVTIASIAALLASGNKTASAAVDIDAISSLSLTGRRLALAAVTIDAISSLTALTTQIIQGEVTITARSSVAADALAYITQAFGYTGTLTAGDVLVIDTDAMTVKLNGSDSRSLFVGTFPKLYVGTNELRYKDGGEVPDLDFETKHEPRYL